MSTPRIAVALTLAAIAAGCTTTTVKSSQTRLLTADDAARADRERRKERTDEQRPAPQRPPTLEAEIERLRAEIEREPQNPKWYFMLGQIYERQGRFELAELRYRKGGELIPADQYTGPHYFLGRVLAKQEKWTQALAELERAIGVKPPDLEGYYLNPDYRESYFLIGAISYRLGDLTTSERSFRQYLKYGGETDRVVQFFPELVAE
jgi:tetratricopeptide (TPR) repeat protein